MNTFRDLLRPRGIRSIFLMGALGITPVFGCDPVELSQLIQNPKSFEGKCVCVTGVTEGDGINFALFRPPHPSQSHRVVLVVNKEEATRYKPLDGHWVQVCGTVTADERGLFACKIFLQTAEDVHNQPIPGRRVFGLFENDGPETVKIEAINKTGNEGMMLILKPGEMQRTVISDGNVKIFAVSEDLSPTKLLSVFTLPTVKSSPNNFERSSRTFYFSFSGRKMSLLKPNEATKMRKRWKALERQGE